MLETSQEGLWGLELRAVPDREMTDFPLDRAEQPASEELWELWTLSTFRTFAWTSLVGRPSSKNLKSNSES